MPNEKEKRLGIELVLRIELSCGLGLTRGDYLLITVMLGCAPGQIERIWPGFLPTTLV